MLLPNGQVLFSASSSNVQVYHPDGGPQEAWRPTITSVTAHTGYYVVQGTQLTGLSQANIYGDDCYPATNYPLVQLTNTSTHKVYYGRTYHFSTMGLAPGSQSCRFTLGNIPGGTYDLRVIANGIRSHAVSFVQLARFKSPFMEVPLKLEFEHYGKLIAEGDPLKWIDQIIDPEINQVRTSLRTLQNSVQRLNSLIQASGLPRVGKGTAARAGADQIRKEQGEKDEQKKEEPGAKPKTPTKKK